MKKIETIIDPAALDAVKLHLAEAGIDGRLTVTEVSGLDNLGRFYRHETAAENPWKPCLKIDLIVSDRQTESAVNIILRQANLAGGQGTGGHINILSLDATLEISTKELGQPFKEKSEPQRRERTPTRGVRLAFTPQGQHKNLGEKDPKNHDQGGLNCRAG
jgi:nitrogen regulatory protein PII